ncbi:MAG: 3-phosphoshikimate 1-carboxyvinyltransferase [Candidatus Omnitrophica bacterium]|nr:3-phosphoshikimate 1-carboxyvinyltransferase [Candidatus Omnitrophota bacterium]
MKEIPSEPSKPLLNATVRSAAPLAGALTMPPDKSIAHRALLIAALCRGTTEITPLPSSEDCARTLQLIEALGVPVRRNASSSVQIVGQGLARPFHTPDADLWCGDSGTTLRLFAGVLAGQPWAARLTAAASLMNRPMRRVIEPLTEMGAVIQGESRGQEVYPPLAIRGRRPLASIRYTMPVASAQVKSAIVLAGLFAEGPTTVIEPTPTRDHTERMARACGGRVTFEPGRVTIESGPLTSPGRLIVPGDISSAAFLAVAASCVSGSRLRLCQVSLNPSRTAWISVLQRMGAAITTAVIEDAGEPSGDVAVEARPLRGAQISPSEVPALIDELPILMVAAACAEGCSRFSGIGELRVKETDRVASMMAGLRRMGIRVESPAPDVIEIEGGRLTGAAVESAADHRTAMSLAVAGLAASGVTTIRGAECVAKSFPEFFEYLQQITPPETVTVESSVTPKDR